MDTLKKPLVVTSSAKAFVANANPYPESGKKLRLSKEAIELLSIHLEQILVAAISTTIDDKRLTVLARDLPLQNSKPV